MDIIFVTGNKHKISDAQKILGFKLNHKDIDLDEIQELDSDKVSNHKVLQAYTIVKQPVVVFDQSIYISCLNDFPGPLIKWFWKIVTLEKICEIANHFNNHKISTKTTITYYDGKEIRHFYGIIKGLIPSEPKGESGFGWDPIFIPEGYDKSFAEISNEEKNKISHYRLALEELRKFLNEKKN